MRKLFRNLVIFSILLVTLCLALFSTGCYATYTVPSGYIGKILNPSGFDSAILNPGQINLGTQSFNGQASRIVLLEATTITVVETFRDSIGSTDHQDHRIMTGDGVPTVVDMYVRLMLPDDDTSRNNIFLTVTPENTQDPRIAMITLNNIYTRFVEMDVRNRVRNIITGYPDFQTLLKNYGKINNDITASVIKAFQDSHVPLKLQDAQLSQVLPDPQVWDSEVKKKSADALAEQIDMIGKHVAQNPGYLEYLKWQALQNIAATGSQKGTNTLIITDSNNPMGIVVNPNVQNITPLPEVAQAPINMTPTPTATKK